MGVESNTLLGIEENQKLIKHKQTANDLFLQDLELIKLSKPNGISIDIEHHSGFVLFQKRWKVIVTILYKNNTIHLEGWSRNEKKEIERLIHLATKLINIQTPIQY